LQPRNLVFVLLTQMTVLNWSSPLLLLMNNFVFFFFYILITEHFFSLTSSFHVMFVINHVLM
jgi:hypothetical protein